MRYGLAATALFGATLVACAGGGAGNGGVVVGGGAGDRSFTAGAGATGDLTPAGGDAAVPPADTLDGNRDRLLATYLAYLKAHPGAQSNGLDGAALAGVCDLWSGLAPSGQALFRTLTARMQGSTLQRDGRSMLGHVATVYRVVGGQNAGAGAPGSCGGGEYNRMIMSMDAALHDALVAANAHQGAAGAGGLYDLADVPP
ncbi:MAG: hypothetical protein ACXVCV_17440, partial [Polyangia bacterium]